MTTSRIVLPDGSGETVDGRLNVDRGDAIPGYSLPVANIVWSIAKDEYIFFLRARPEGWRT